MSRPYCDFCLGTAVFDSSLKEWVHATDHERIPPDPIDSAQEYHNFKGIVVLREFLRVDDRPDAPQWVWEDGPDPKI